MNSFKSFCEKIKSGKIQDFEALAMDVFRYQSTHNEIYRKYLEVRGIQSENIPVVELQVRKTVGTIFGLKNSTCSIV